MSAPSLSSLSTGALVSELSQAEYQLRAWSGIDTPGWEHRAGISLEQVHLRRDQVRSELRDRGLDLPEVSAQPSVTAGGYARDESDTSALQADAAVLAAKVANLERGLVTRTVIGQAEGLLMERHGITVEEAFQMLRHVSSVTNRKLRVIAAELVENRAMPEVKAPGARGAGESR